MYFLTQEENSIESGVYATRDEDGTTIVQFFVDKDDATCYNEQLNAVGFELSISEAPDDLIDKLCDVLGHAYSVVEPGDIVIPKLEILQQTLGEFFDT
tara:strand:- start:6964 stop:7257 length:294 start_codon:yes stop_codon:yes gene_type:complete